MDKIISRKDKYDMEKHPNRKDLEKNPWLVFRMARFATYLPEWRLDSELCDELRRLPCEILSLVEPGELGVELIKALSGLKPSRFFRVLAECDCLEPWFPEINEMRFFSAGGEGRGFSLMCERLDAAAGDAKTVWGEFCKSIDETVGCDAGPAEEVLEQRYQVIWIIMG